MERYPPGRLADRENPEPKAPDRQSVSASSGRRRLALLAVIIGGCTIVACCLVGYTAYHASREALFRRVARENLTLARTVANYVAEQPAGGDEEAMKQAFDQVRSFWHRFNHHASEAFLCVIKPNGEMAVSTANPSMQGSIVSDLLLAKPTPQGGLTIGDLLAEKRDFWGESITLTGQRQLVGFCYSSVLDCGVMVHFPAAQLEDEMVATSRPWGAGVALVAFLLIPLSLGLMHRSYSSAQRAAEQSSSALCESEKRYRNLFHQAPISLWEEDFSALAQWFAELRGTGVSDLCEYLQCHPEAVQEAARLIRVVDVNEGTLHLFGVGSMAELLSTPVKAVEEQRGSVFTHRAFADQLMAIWEGRRRFETEFTASTPEGAQVDCLLQWVAPGAPGNLDFSHVIIAISDITGRKRAEKELRLRQFAIEHSSDPIYWVKADGGIAYANRAACRALGYDAEELLSMSVPDFDPDFPRGAWPEHWERMKGTGTVTFEAHHRTKQGRVFPVEITTNYLEHEGQEYIWAYARDITERKEAEEALRKSEERFRAIFEDAPVGISVTDSVSGRFIEINKEFGDICGYSQQEMLKASFQEISHPDDLDADLRNMRNLLDGTIKNFEMEKRYFHKDGSTIWVSMTCVPLWKTEGDPRIHLTIVQDITDRKRAEQALREAHEELEQRVEQRTVELVAANAQLRSEITEREQVETELRTSEKRYRAVVEDQTELICRWKPDGCLLFVNDAYCRYFQRSRDELVGHSFWPFIPEEDRQGIRDQIASLGPDNRVGTVEHRAFAPDGQVRWQQWTNHAIFDVQGRLSEYQSVGRDITESRHAEQALLESEERFRRAVVDAPVPMMIHAEDGEILRINRAWTDLTGYHPEEIPTMADWTERAYGERQEAVRERIDKLFRIDGRVAEGEYTITTKDGRTIIWDFSSSPLGHLEDGRRLVLSIATDVTERKRVLQALRESEARTQAVLDAALNVIISIDDRGIVQSFNSRAERDFGYAAAEIIGQNVKVIMPSPDREQHDGHLATYLNSGRSRILCTAREVVGRRKDGSTFPLELSVTEARVGDWRVFVGVLQDLTERKLAVEQIHKHQEELAHMSRLSTMGEMATGLAHELNQPLASIVNYTQGCIRKLQAGTADTNEIISILGEASGQAKRAGDIMRRIRHFVRKKTLKRVEVNFAELVEQVSGLLRNELESRGVNIEIHIDKRVGKIRADRIQLQQVLVNLITNSMEAMEQIDEAQRTVTLRASCEKDGLLAVRVADNGCGLPQGSDDEIFEPFYTTKPNGTGMGLAISRTIVEAHGGQLRARDNVDGGCTFCFSLPRRAKA